MTEDKKHEYVNTFLHTIKILIKEVSQYIPDNPNLYRIKKRIALAIELDPNSVFQKVGKKLYKYKEFIYDESTEDFLIQHEFPEVANENDKEIEDASTLIINELKKAMKVINSDQKKYYRQMVISLLDIYIEYTCLT